MEYRETEYIKLRPRNEALDLCCLELRQLRHAQRQRRQDCQKVGRSEATGGQGEQLFPFRFQKKTVVGSKVQMSWLYSFSFFFFLYTFL